MASSRGRAKLAERSNQRFAFGSSTPRELSYISQVPPVFRAIDNKSQKEIASRSYSASSVLANSVYNAKPPTADVRFYIRQAHSGRSSTLTPNSVTRSFVFGSSTPREFSHLNKIVPALRVYDAKVQRKKDAKARPPTNNEAKRLRSVSSNPRQVVGRVEDDISSEPDIVQDRRYDFAELHEQRKFRRQLQLADQEQQQQEPSKVESEEVASEQKSQNVVEVDANSAQPPPQAEETKVNGASPQPRTSTAEETTVHHEQEVQELSTEVSQPVKLINQVENEPLNDRALTVPKVYAHDDSNAVFMEDTNALEADADLHESLVVMSLGSLKDDAVADALVQHTAPEAEVARAHNVTTSSSSVDSG